MENEKQLEEILSRLDTATTTRMLTRMDRSLQVPLEVYRDEQGQFILVKGHRRKKACLILADDNKKPNFVRDLEIEGINLNPTPVDLLIRSIRDTEVRLNLNRTDRIRVAKKLRDACVPDQRAARAMGISMKTYRRDLLAARRAK